MKSGIIAVRDAIHLERPGARLVGERCGEGPAILLLHAGGESRRVWLPVTGLLSDRGFQTVAFDQRGHGDSGGASSDGVLAFGDDAKAMIGLAEQPVVVGASLGGFALMLALEEMEGDVAGLVLVDVTPDPDPQRTRAYLGPRAGLAGSPLVEDILSRASILTKIVGELRLPIMLVCGGTSPLGADARASFRKLCPHADIRIVESAGHLVARDAPIELASIIGDFAQRTVLGNDIGQS